jgi:hypothetical protein
MFPSSATSRHTGRSTKLETPVYGRISCSLWRNAKYLWIWSPSVGNWLWYSAARQDLPSKEGKRTPCPNIRCFKTWNNPTTHKTRNARSKAKLPNKSAVQLQVTSLHVGMHCCKHLYFLTFWELNSLFIGYF